MADRTGRGRASMLRIAFGAGVALSAISAPQALLAQDVDVDTDEQTEDADDAIIVTGIRSSLEDALSIRRNADVILDGISADDIGSTPDLNLGEALARIPGVQINREAARRDATISVRGLPGRFTLTTVQGQRIASTTRGGSTGNPFGIFESSIFSGANIVKSFTPDTPAGGLAAQADLRLRSALERREGFAVRAEVTAEETTGDYNPQFFVTGAQRFGDRFGVYGTVSYSEQSFRRDSFRINDYQQFTNAEVAGFANGTRVSGRGDGQESLTATANPFFDIAPVGENGLDNAVIYPAAIRQIVQNNRGFRVSGAAGFAFELSDDITFRVDGIYTQRDLGESNQDIFIANRTNNSLTSPLSAPISLGATDFNDDREEENIFLVPRVFISDNQTAIGNRRFPALDEAWAIYPQFNFENDNWRVNVIGTYSEALGRAQLNQYDVRVRERGGNANTRAPDANLDGIDDRGTGSFLILDNGLGELGNVFVDNEINPALLNLDNRVGNFRIETGSAIGARDDIRIPAVNGQEFNSPISFLALGFNDGADRDLLAVDFDIYRTFENSLITEIGAGAYYSRENSERFRFEFSALGLNFPAITSDILTLNDGVTEGAFFLGNRLPGVEIDNFLSIDIPVLEGQLFPATGGQVDNLTFTPSGANLRAYFPELTTESAQSVTVDELLTALEAVPGFEGNLLPRLPQNRTIDTNFDSTRDTIEAFGLVRFDFGEISDLELRGTVGVRYVKTDLNGQVRPISAVFYDNLAAIRAANGGDPLVFRDGADLNFAPAGNTFERFLPSVNLIYEFAPDLVARAAYYETFEALDLAEFSPTPTFIRTSEPGTEFDDENADPGLVGSDGEPIPRTTISIASLSVEPRRSRAFDLGLSWYTGRTSVVSVGVFRKNLIGDISLQRNFCPAGENLTVDGQTFNNIRFADINSPNPIEARFAGNCVFDNENGDPQRIRVNRTINNPDTIDITGIEAQVQQTFDFLPGLLGNTGVILNYTRVRSGGDNEVRLFNVAEDTYNLIGFYEDDIFQFRLAYNAQTEIQRQGGSSFTGGSTIIAPRDQLDFTGRIRPLRNLEIRAEVFNITNSSRREFVGFEQLFRLFEYDGRTYSLSASYRF